MCTSQGCCWDLAGPDEQNALNPVWGSRLLPRHPFWSSVWPLPILRVTLHCSQEVNLSSSAYITGTCLLLCDLCLFFYCAVNRMNDQMDELIGTIFLKQSLSVLEALILFSCLHTIHTSSKCPQITSFIIKSDPQVGQVQSISEE